MRSLKDYTLKYKAEKCTEEGLSPMLLAYIKCEVYTTIDTMVYRMSYEDSMMELCTDASKKIMYNILEVEDDANSKQVEHEIDFLFHMAGDTIWDYKEDDAEEDDGFADDESRPYLTPDLVRTIKEAVYEELITGLRSLDIESQQGKPIEPMAIKPEAEILPFIKGE